MKIKDVIVFIVLVIALFVVTVVIPMSILRGINFSIFGTIENLQKVCSNENATDEIRIYAGDLYEGTFDIIKEQRKEFYLAATIMGIIFGGVLVVLGILFLKDAKLKAIPISIITAGVTVICVYLYLNLAYPFYSSAGKVTEEDKEWLESHNIDIYE